ncbi:hypothetical protein GEP11_23235 [Salmonella enterica subsp. enterica serovar Anatum]|nr:hypothetical protein [Salmonella enterica subsp. enterica serovar Anatum]
MCFNDPTTPALSPLSLHDALPIWRAKTGGKADHNGLYIHWVGGNDLAAAIARPAMAPASSNSPTCAAALVALLDRKSTRCTQVTTDSLVCRLLIEKKTNELSF